MNLFPPNLYTFSSLSAGAFCLAIAIFSFFRGEPSRAKSYFSLESLAVGLWTLFPLLTTIAQTDITRLWVARAIYIAAVFTPPCFMFLAGELAASKGKAYHRAKWTGLWIGVFFFVMLPTPWFIAGVQASGNFRAVQAGVLYHFYVVFFSISFSYAFLILGKGIKASLGIKRNQLKYVFLSFVSGCIGGTLHFLAVYLRTEPIPHDIFVIGFTALLALAILRTQLLDIQVVIKRTLIFAGLSAFTLLVISVMTIGMQGGLERAFGVSRLYSSVLAALVIILAYEPVKLFLVRSTDRFLFQSKYDYKHILNVYIESVSVEMDLDQVARATTALLNDTLHPRTCLIFLHDPIRNDYVAHGEPQTGRIGPDSPLLPALFRERGPLTRASAGLSQNVLDELIRIGAQIAVPLLFKGDLLGLMLLGEKLSDEDYSREELLVLADVVKTAAIAIKNARYVEQINAANSELMRAQMMKQVADMADGMSHQFNNRFFSISSPLGLLRKKLERLKGQVWDIEDPHKQVQALKEFLEMAEGVWSKVESNAVRGGDLAKGLLRYSRPEKAGFQMHNISDIVTLSLEMLSYKHDDLPTVEIQHKFDSSVPKTWANASYLQDVFFILLDNSYDAIKQKEALKGDFKGVISIYVGADSLVDSIIVTIQDNGIGMKPEILEKVRAAIPYVTTKPSSSEKSGYGSGVQVLNRLVDLHGGRIQYDSVYNEGTRVVIKFPVRLPVTKS